MINTMNYTGEKWVPYDVRRRRAWHLETLRRLGTPVLVKHMFNAQDVKNGIAERSPGLAEVFGQPRHNDPLSHGVGFVSVEKSDDEWYNTTTGAIVKSATNPGVGYAQAPKYRGFGEGFLTYALVPDAMEDLFKLTKTGAMIQIQTARVQGPWYPDLNDNDLLIHVVIDNNYNILETKERYQLKMTNPITMRGHQKKGRREGTEIGGNRYPIGIEFEMTLVPQTDVLYDVDADR